MQSKPQIAGKDISATTKPKNKSEQLKEQIRIEKQKLANLKIIANPQLLLNIREIEKQIKRIEIITLNESGSSIIKNFTKNPKQLINSPTEPHVQKQLTNEQNLAILKNITTKNYSKKPVAQNTQTNKDRTPPIKPFSSIDYIQQLEQKTAPHVMENQIYPLLNRYLSYKSSLLSKIIQLNPQKRHNNSLLVPHQRVILKEHLDSIRRMNNDLQKKSQQLQDELDHDFILVKNKWEESQRELLKLSQ